VINKISVIFIDGNWRVVHKSDREYPVPAAFSNGLPIFTPSPGDKIDFRIMSPWLASRLKMDRVIFYDEEGKKRETFEYAMIRPWISKPDKNNLPFII
jgi:hypothetical protein